VTKYRALTNGLENAMSDFTAIGMIMALATANMFVYFRLDRRLSDAWAEIATGVIRGVPVSTKVRSQRLHGDWLFTLAAGIAFQAIFAVGWLLLARNVSTEEVKLFAYMIGFIALIGLSGWTLMSPFWYSYLRSVLREAEQG
jgi:hypothetical protein